MDDLRHKAKASRSGVHCSSMVARPPNSKKDSLLTVMNLIPKQMQAGSAWLDHLDSALSYMQAQFYIASHTWASRAGRCC